MLVYTTPLPNLILATLIGIIAILIGIKKQIPIKITTLIFSISILLGLFHLAVGNGPAITNLFFVHIKMDGLHNAIQLSSRLFAVSLLTLIVTATTPLSSILNSLKKIGVPYRYAFALTLALRFVPLLQKEAESIKSAMVLRGCKKGFDLFWITHNFKILISSLSVKAFYMGQIASSALETRGFGLYADRTAYKKTKINLRSLILVGMIAIFSIALKIFEVNEKLLGQ